MFDPAAGALQFQKGSELFLHFPLQLWSEFADGLHDQRLPKLSRTTSHLFIRDLLSSRHRRPLRGNPESRRSRLAQPRGAVLDRSNAHATMQAWEIRRRDPVECCNERFLVGLGIDNHLVADDQRDSHWLLSAHAVPI